jgi:short-subunit dehydrogenase
MHNIDNIAVVTGASSGIGEALSLQLSLHGYHVVLASRSIEKLNEIAKRIKNDGGNCSVVEADVSSPESIKNLKFTVEKLGSVAVVVNNSGVGQFAKFSEATLEEWDTQINTNLRGAFLVSQAFIEQMQENKKGTLVFINSVAGKHGYPFSAAYVASKYGLRGLSESLRNELRPDNIKVISIHPGAVDSSFWDGVNVDFPRDEMLDSQVVADTIIHAINAPGITTIEELTIRRVGGDF